MHDGRFAPSPTGALHLGNLRTALLAWLFARSTGSRFSLRVEDLDATGARPEHERQHLADLSALGLDWDGPVVRQSDHLERYLEAIARLADDGLVYPCYCTRREILEAASAPHGPHLPDGAYPGTCRELSTGERARREAGGRRPALRLRAGGETVTFTDRMCGPVEGVVDDFVLRRNDGAPAYNLAVIVDDDAMGIGEVVRGDDLLLSTPRQLFLAELLGLHAPAYAHVPLVLNSDGQRLAKRDGAVTLGDRRARGETPEQVLSLLAASLALCEPGEPVTTADLAERFHPQALPPGPWVLPASLL
jgi:glutamyl-tRNA synthetase